MKPSRDFPRLRPLPALMALALSTFVGSLHAQSSDMPDELRQAESLIGALMQRGMLPRARGEEMLREARQRAGRPAAVDAAAPARMPPVAAASDEGTRTALRARVKAELREEVRAEVRREVRDEVLGSARELLARVEPAHPPAAVAATAPLKQPTRLQIAQAAPTVAPPALPMPPAAPVANPPVAAPAAPVTTPSNLPSDPDANRVATAAAPGAVPANAVRVPYVPKVVRDAIRNEIKEEILAQARTEQWGAPAAQVPEWTDRLKVSGDIRVRSQRDGYGKDNPDPEDFLLASLAGTTRAADLAAGTAAGLPLANTTDDRSRLRLRARLAVDAKITDSVSAGLRLATGSATDRVSTNQTLGQNANRYQFLLDRAYVRIDQGDWLSVTAGRVPNPWFATDLQWSENLNFEGLSGTLKWPVAGARRIEPFLTLGWFPIREDAPPRSARSLSGVQAGFQWELGRTRLRFGLAQYSYRNVEGQLDEDYDPTLGAGRSYGQYEYEAGLRQRGNTLFLTNNPAEVAAGLTPDRFRWGLASRFKPQALTLAAELSHFAPTVVLLSAEMVRNAAFDRAEIFSRTGVLLADGSNTGIAFKATIGAPEVRLRGQWQASLGYRRVGSDAVLDAFTDGDLGLGGTNLSGVTAGFIYGLDRNVTLGARVLSARQLDSMTVQPTVKSKYSIDSVQVDLHARF